MNGGMHELNDALVFRCENETLGQFGNGEAMKLGVIIYRLGHNYAPTEYIIGGREAGCARVLVGGHIDGVRSFDEGGQVFPERQVGL